MTDTFLTCLAKMIMYHVFQLKNRRKNFGKVKLLNQKWNNYNQSRKQKEEQKEKMKQLHQVKNAALIIW